MQVTLHFPHLTAQPDILSDKLIPTDKSFQAHKTSRIGDMSSEPHPQMKILTIVNIALSKTGLHTSSHFNCYYNFNYFRGSPQKVLKDNSTATGKFIS